MTPQPPEQPRTAAGRQFLAILDGPPLPVAESEPRSVWLTRHILAIEDEAAASDPVASPALEVLTEAIAQASDEWAARFEAEHPDGGYVAPYGRAFAEAIVARLPVASPLDVERLAAMFHAKNREIGLYCHHNRRRNGPQLSKKDCGIEALAFAAEYAPLEGQPAASSKEGGT